MADAIPFGLAWLAGGSYFTIRRRHLRTSSRLYFGGWFLYPGLLAGSYFLDRICFSLVSLPILVFLPSTEFYSSADCSLRAAAKGFLAPPQVALITPVGLALEKHHGTVNRDEVALDEPTAVTDVTIIPAFSSDTLSVMITSPTGKQKLTFPH